MGAFHCPTCGKVNRVDAARADKARCGACQTPIDTQNTPFYVGDDELATLVGSSPVTVLVDFYADWCGPCRTLAPTLQELARRHPGQLLIAKVDTDKNPKMAGQLGVSGIPALFVYKGGKVVDKTAGARSLGAMEAWIGQHLG
jgi:thioredoxin 2